MKKSSSIKAITFVQKSKNFHDYSALDDDMMDRVHTSVKHAQSSIECIHFTFFVPSPDTCPRNT